MNQTKMIIVTEVKTLEVSQSEWVYYKKLNPYTEVRMDNELGNPIYEEMNVLSELIIGRRYVKENGDLIMIGQTKEVADTVGIQHEAFRNSEERVSILYVENRKLCQLAKDQNKVIEDLNSMAEIVQEAHKLIALKLLSVINASFMTRLRYLFKF